MEATKLKIPMIIMFIAIVMTGSAFGQIIYGQKSSGDLSLIYSYWKIDSSGSEKTLSQFSIPVGGFIPIEDNFEARFYIGNAFNSLDMGNDDYTLSGLGDLRVQFNRSFENDRYLLSVGLNLPTGKKKLSSADEKDIVSLLSSSYLTFPVRRLGQGFGINAMAGAATFWNDIRAGFSAMYQYNGSYDPYDDIADYKPGDFFTLAASADMRNREWFYLLSLAYTIYSNDKVDGDKIFKQSNNFDARLNATYSQKEIDYSGVVRMLLRGENSYYDALSNRLDERLFGNEFSVFLSANYHPTGKWHLDPILEYTSIADNDRGDGSSSLFGFGGDYVTELSDKIDLRLGAKYYIGSAAGGDLDITGLQLSTSLMAAF
ncbi:MAG: hypothetical protein ABIJ45_04200 [Candidatus Zixiibacteriota bacterium]